MASEVEASASTLEAVLGGEDKGVFSREEVLDALAFLTLRTTLSTGELPTDPRLVECLERWRSRVLCATQDEPELAFPARVERYLEIRPLNPQLLPLLEACFDWTEANREHHVRSRAEKLLGTTTVTRSEPAPKTGSSWLEIRASQRTP